MIVSVLTYIAAPLVGGVIGYITNDIAIRMLFRPHTAKYVFGVKIPFTPGIIPKEKGRIAEAIGGAISQNLINQEVLERYLLSNEMTLKIRQSVEEFLNIQKSNQESVAEYLRHYLTEEELQGIVASVNSNLTNQVHTKLSDSEVGKNVAHVVVENVVEKIKAMDPTEILSGLAGGIGGLKVAAATMFGGSILGKFFSLLREPAENLLANNINGMLQKNGAEIVSNMIGNEVQTFMDTPMAKLLKGKDEQIAQAVNTVESVYRTIISEHLPRILKSIDISKIVRERINEMDVNETETLIFQVMNKELKAIVWLGALLGMIMGTINILL
jgi:uncharacterized membrane protein YheB (UPF0754 family)